MKRTALLIVLLLAGAAGCRVKGVRTVAWTGAGAAMPDRFSVLCWNVEKGKHKALSARLQALAAEFAPDLVFLQEAGADLVHLPGYGAVFAPGWSYPWPGGRQIGVAILSTVQPAGTQKLPTRDREFGITAPKVSLAATWDLPGDATLLVINVHALAFETGSKLPGFRRQLDDIAAAADDHDGPILLAGDLNTWSESRLGLVREMTSRLNLVEVTSFAGGVPRTTANMGSESSNRSYGVNPDLPIDRVYVRGLTVDEAVVLDEAASDHVPFLVRLRVATD